MQPNLKTPWNWTFSLPFHSVNIKAESQDPSSSWRSLIPVIKVNISTVSATKGFGLQQQERVSASLL